MKSRIYKASASAAAIALACGLAGTASANDDVLALQAEPGNNMMPSITYNGWNYSTLDQITLANVADLQIAWTWQVGIQDQHEAPPLVVGDTMYIVSPKPNYVYALDLNTDGVIKWEFRPDMNVELATQQTCCGGQTRGIYFAEGKLFYATLDGQVFGLDAATGEALWRTVGTNISYGEGMAGNGLVVGNLFIVGNEGGERGARGKVHAYDINTGNLQWMMYSMGPDNEVGITPAYQPFYEDDRTSLATWYGDSWRRGGGTAWGYFTWDPDSNLFHYSTGNCGPWNPDYRREWGVVNLDENGGLIDYRNNWCAGQLARDATTGNLVWAYGLVPADGWDLDQPLITPLIDAEINGEMRNLAIKASRNGYFYVWDRNTGELVVEPWPFVYVDYMTGVDMETGRALYNLDHWPFTTLEDRRRYTQVDPGRNADGTTVADYTGTEIHACPGAAARNWQNDAYSPRTGLLYTPTSAGCFTQVVIEGEYTPGEGYTLRRAAGAHPIPRRNPDWTSPQYGELIEFVGFLQANDPVAGVNAWRHGWTIGNNAPVMATATDVLFQIGVNNGTLRAFDATNGEIVWEFRTGARGNATPISYLGPDGRQYIAYIASSAANNGAVALDDAPDNANRYRRSGSTLYVFGLPETVAGN
jgi:PQQ-dependent dehydrogenase (methanol/ethanol family)